MTSLISVSITRPRIATLFPYTTLFRSLWEAVGAQVARLKRVRFGPVFLPPRLRSGRYTELSKQDHRVLREDVGLSSQAVEDRKSTRLNSSHVAISYAVFCLKIKRYSSC